MPDLLLVEDDAPLGRGLRTMLLRQGFGVQWVTGLRAAGEALAQGKYDLLLLDIRLPDGNGVDFCRALRQTDDIPVIFLTACDGDEDTVRGLDAGGDDYIAKPFSADILLSRIRAVLRRGPGAQGQALCSADILVQPKLRRVSVGGQETSLTPIEYSLLTALLRSEGRILTRATLLQSVWDMGGEFVEDNTLSVHMLRLRRKLRDEAEDPVYIKTMRGVGYRWLPPVRKAGFGS